MSWYTSPELWERLKPVARELRQEPTRAETVLWQSLRNRKLGGLKFRRQHTFERFVLDFYCHEAQLVVEVDGGVHQYTREQDAVRQTFLENQGLRVLRFSNDEVLTDQTSVLEKIAASATAPPSSASPSPFTERGLGGEVTPAGAESSLPQPQPELPLSAKTERGLGGEVSPAGDEPSQSWPGQTTPIPGAPR